MIYLVFQLIGTMLFAALCGALLLLLAQSLWGRFGLPLRSRSLELELEELRADREEQERRMDALKSETAQAQAKVGELQKSRRQLTATLDARNRAMQQVESQLASLEKHSNGSPSMTEALRKELRTAVRERDALKEELRHASVRGDRLRTELEVLHGIHERMLNDMESFKSQLQEAELQAQSAKDSRPPAWVMLRPFGPRDDLQRLEGVDDALEETLNNLGLYHYHQIARFENHDVEWIASHVDGVPAQMIRDSWIVEASRLSGVPREGSAIQADN